MKDFIARLGIRSWNAVLHPNKAWKALVFVSFLLVPFSELRNIDYRFVVNRSISIAVLLFLVILTIDFLRTANVSGPGHVLRKPKRVLYILVAYAAFILHKLIFWSSLHEVNAMALYTLLGVLVVMVLTFLVISDYPENDVMNGIYCYSLAIAFFFLLIYLAARLFEFHVIYIGIDTAELHFPFIFRPYQSATLGAVSLMLGMGAAVTLGKSRALYFTIPVMFLGIAETGCRSVMWLLTVACLMMLGYYGFFYRTLSNNIKAGFRDAGIGIVMAFSFLFLFMDDQIMRAVSFLATDPSDLLMAAADLPRNQMWMSALTSFSHGTPLDHGIVGSLHNVYLDILVNGGLIALILFVTFIGLMMFAVASLAIRRHGSESQPLYVALCISLLLIAGEFYANPMLHLPFVYMFFGLVLAILSIKRVSGMNADPVPPA